MDNRSPQQSKRRKLEHTLDEKNSFDHTAVAAAENAKETAGRSLKSEQRQWMAGVRVPDLIRPRSTYRHESKTTDTNSVAEQDVLDQLIRQDEIRDPKNTRSILSIELHDFSIYRAPHTRMIGTKNSIALEESGLSSEFVGLQDVDTPRCHEWFADGILLLGEKRIEFQHLRCDAWRYTNCRGKCIHWVGDQIWIQTIIGFRSNVWYRLKNPAPEYLPYYRPFLWLLELAKHIMDYLTDNKYERMTLQHFRHNGNFGNWLRRHHQGNSNFRQWASEVEGVGFGSVIAANIRFLSAEISNAGLDTQWYFVRTEIDPTMLKAVPSQEVKTRQTTVTPYVYQCFQHMPWVHFLEVHSAENTHLKSVGAADPELKLDREKHMSRPEVTIRNHSVKIGDVVALPSDTRTWRGTDSVWYAYVQGLHEIQHRIRLDLIWLYRPTDTPCQNMHYPHAGELFLGTHCNCGDAPIYTYEVLSKPRVAFFCQDDESDFFVRQKYDDGESAWLTLQESDFRCKCEFKKTAAQYQSGDTVLVEIDEDTLEPFEVVETSPEFPQVICGRKLIRRTDTQAQPNELLYSTILVRFPQSKIIRSCHVRFFTVNEYIPPPYCYQGISDFFFITHEITCVGTIEPLATPWPSMTQGLSTETNHNTLQGLDIFCGGGNFGRGLEEGGAVEFKWVVDYYKEAIHTYKANAVNDAAFYFGSVNDYLRQAIKGKRIGHVAQKEEVEFIAAGSPCPPFSTANQHKGRAESQRNASMVASVVSFIDFYRPKYAVLENVTGMAICGQDRGNQNVFAQVLCALVGLGYQVQPFRLDAWSFGSPQSRTRLFITITAPGLSPMEAPAPTHSHPDHIKAACLGRNTNGLPFSGRYWEPTPFRYVTIQSATQDLPLNDHGKIQSIRFPDHRMSRNLTSNNRIRISSISKNPSGMTFVKAAKKGWMPRRQVDAYTSLSVCRTHDLSKSWQRVNPTGLLPTVMTSCTPEDGIAGICVHWEADRLMTVMEARRAQGYPDHEVIVGNPATQWKIIGNSVARPVALALGLALRRAWEKTSVDRREQSKDLMVKSSAKSMAAWPTTPEQPLQTFMECSSVATTSIRKTLQYLSSTASSYT